MTLKSLGIFVGTGDCNARCSHCAGLPHRKYTPKQDGIIDKDLIYKTLVDCYNQGARSLTISGSGEPTLSPISVTKTLELVDSLSQQGKAYEWINLYSNGIRIGQEKSFSETYLPQWQRLGLKTVYITVHDLNEKKNAETYGVNYYPNLETIVSRIHNTNLLTRANIVLTKQNAQTHKDYIAFVQALRQIGFDHISAWPIRNENDIMDTELAPPAEELEKMKAWAEQHETPEHRLRVLGNAERVVYDACEKLTLFPDGTLSNTWCG